MRCQAFGCCDRCTAMLCMCEFAAILDAQAQLNTPHRLFEDGSEVNITRRLRESYDSRVSPHSASSSLSGEWVMSVGSLRLSLEIHRF